MLANSTLWNHTLTHQHVSNFLSFGTSSLVTKGAKPSDKFTSHSYHTMYGMFLTPMLLDAEKEGKKLKVLEIGLGCGAGAAGGGGPGKSASLWKHFFGENGEIWFAEYDEGCVKREKQAGRMEGFNIVTGDQANVTTLHQWVNETKGNFDVIIDDGGHANRMIKTSFDVLFPQALRPGGLYFMEDLHVGRTYAWGLEPEKYPVMAEVIESWIDQLLIDPRSHWLNSRKVHKNTSAPSCPVQHPLPSRIKWIFCQADAAVIAKCLADDPSRCS